MQISGSIPIHIARAYGLPAQSAPKRVPAATPVTPTRAIDARVAEPPSDKLGNLIGGTVSGAIDFRTASPSVNGSFQLYTRAADKIEAAVSVQIGHSLDVKG